MAGDYISIVGLKHYFGMSIFRVGQILELKKDHDNEYDDEAIKVELPSVGQVGSVANSYYTVARGTKSAGRIYDTFDETCRCRVCFIIKDTVIAELVS